MAHQERSIPISLFFARTLDPPGPKNLFRETTFFINPDKSTGAKQLHIPGSLRPCGLPPSEGCWNPQQEVPQIILWVPSMGVKPSFTPKFSRGGETTPGVFLRVSPEKSAYLCRDSLGNGRPAWYILPLRRIFILFLGKKICSGREFSPN